MYTVLMRKAGGWGSIRSLVIIWFDVVYMWNEYSNKMVNPIRGH